MNLLENGIFQDGIKLMVYIIPLAFLVVKKRGLNLRYYWLFLAGLSLLAFGHTIDFLDEFVKHSDTSRFSDYYQLFDFFEDMVGFALGFAVFITALYLEYLSPRKR